MILFLLKIIFWISLLGAATPYGIYPRAVWLAWRLRRRPPQPRPWTPTVTVIIPAHNEEAVIGRRIDNLLALDYPAEALQVIVVSDASTDRTNQIVSDRALQGHLEFLPLAERHGKTGAQNAALSLARGEVLVYSDASTLFRPDALRKLVRYLADPEVGCVGGMVVLTSTGDFTGRAQLGRYLRFEQSLRHREGEIWTTHGLNGCFYAIRATLAAPLDDSRQIDDLTNGLRTIAAGQRVVYAQEALCAEALEVDSPAGFQRRVRSSLGGICSILSMPELLHPLRHPFVALQLLGHKLLRFLLIPLLLACLMANLGLLGEGALYRLVLAGQITGWGCVALGALGGGSRLLRPFRFCFSFTRQHLASTLALALYLSGKRQRATRWETHKS